MTQLVNFTNIQELAANHLQSRLGLNSASADAITATASVLALIVFAVFIDRLARLLISWLEPKIVNRLGSETPKRWEAALGKQLVASRSAHIVGALVFYRMVPQTLVVYPGVLNILCNLIEGYLVVVATLAVNSVLQAAKDVWNETDRQIGVPIRFATQAAQVLVWAVSCILVVAVVFDLTITVLLSGLAGMAAILALVFRDSILGFVAGIQLSGNDMLRIGDWIDAPQYGADGTVEEIALTTVKVRNFDETISTIPSHALVNESFRNWRGMWEADARRIIRSINLDMSKVQFLTDEAIAELQGVKLLEEVVDQLRPVSSSPGRELINNCGPHEGLTNVGLYRIYLKKYLGQHPAICSNKIVMVRQLPAGPHGLPVEIYAFSNDIRWEKYEAIQSEIIDHAIAILPVFGLDVLQLPKAFASDQGK